MHEMTGDRAENPNAEATARFHVAIQFAIDGDLRFISHRDEQRMLARALTRAGWPLAYSQGFNPRPGLVLPLPRSVGTAAAGEWALVELNEPHAPEQLHQSLAAVLPAGCRLLRVITLAARAKPRPRRAGYTVELEPEHATQAGARIAGLLTAKTLTVERTYGPGRPSRAIDIRPYLEKVTLEGRTLSMRLTFVAQRTARPREVLTALDLPAAEYNHRVQRVRVDWNIELVGPAPRPASTERNNVGREESCNAQKQEARHA